MINIITKKIKGFTFLELLIVIGLVAILAGVVIVAVNPAKQFGKANDSERKSELGAILEAVYKYQTSPTARGSFPKGYINGVLSDIPDCGTNYAGALELGTPVDTKHIDLSDMLIPSYLQEFPSDPSKGHDSASTGYWICQNTEASGVNRVYVIAGGAEIDVNDGGCTVPGTTNPAMCVSE